MKPRVQGPLYQQIADGLRRRAAALGPGSRIPSEPQLAREWGVSRFTVARAVEQLVEEGLIRRRQGSGSFVAEPPLRRAPGYLLSFTQAVEAAGHRAAHRLLAYAEASWHDGLPYPREADLLLLDRLRLVDGVAVARHRSVLPARLAAEVGLTEEVAADPAFSLYRHFEEHGLSVETATERLVACAASAEDRRLLELPEDAVVVAVTRNSFAVDGTPLDAVSAVYDARRYSYEAQLVRRLSPGNGSQQENIHDQAVRDRSSHLGARLGPWSN